MINRLFRRPALHEHAEAAQRLMGVEMLPPGSGELAQLLATDPAPEVRIAAIQRCASLDALAAAWDSETDASVRDALASTLSKVLAETEDHASAKPFLESDRCTDAIRSAVARQASDPELRLLAIAGIQDEEPLFELAIAAKHAGTRMAAAERLRTPEHLRKLADAARNKDHGVARLARQRIAAMEDRAGQMREADSILEQLEALASSGGPILTPMVELNRRWQALDLTGDEGRLARCEAARKVLQERFDRENDEQRAHAAFERRLREWASALPAPSAGDEVEALKTELAKFRDEGERWDDPAARSELDRAERYIVEWDQKLQALAASEALVHEAEQLAASTSIDHADLPERWQALDRSIRTPALTQRFEAALTTVEKRRLAQMHVAQEEATAMRAHVHELLHSADQALTAGQLAAARAAAEKIKALDLPADALPKSITQRMSRFRQQLAELERWASFGQYNARIQLCERAEALAARTVEPPRVAREVRHLRDEWKALDQQHAGVPKALWERFDRACEKAYAPAAKHFAQQAQQRKDARKAREDFIDAAGARATALLAEPRDWHAMERWLRDTDRSWREDNLGGLERGAWKELDTRLKAVLGPLRNTLTEARDRAKVDRQALITEVEALVPKATEPGTPSQVKAISTRWQEQARALPLPQRDERALWQQFRAACDAVFGARQAKRKEEDTRKQEHRRGLEEVCAELEGLAAAKDKDDQLVRRTLRELQDRWRQRAGRHDPSIASVESRYKAAVEAAEALVSTRARSRETTVWRTLAAKERICEEIDGAVHGGRGAPEGAPERWAGLPALPVAWERKLVARRDAALIAAGDGVAAEAHRARIEGNAEPRRAILLELEVLLGLESPRELQGERLALQVKLLSQRFQGAAATGATAAGERLVAWCAEPGVADARDRSRCERAFSAMERAR